MTLLRAGAAAGLLLLCALQLLALVRAPAAWMPSQVTLALARGESMTFGRDALGVPGGSGALDVLDVLGDDAAAALRLRLRRDYDGSWWLASAGAGQPFVLEQDDLRRRSGSVPLAPGQRFRLGTARFAVDAQAGDSVSLSAPAYAASANVAPRPAVRWHYDGATLLRNGAPQPACPDARAGARLAALWNRIAPGVLTMSRPLVFGGNLDCGNRIAIDGLAAPAAMLARSSDGIVLSAGSGMALAPLLLADGLSDTPLAERPLCIEDGATLLLGRTRLQVRHDGDLLQLRPANHVALYTQPASQPEWKQDQLRLPPGVTWSWTRRALWELPSGTHLPAHQLTPQLTHQSAHLSTYLPALLAGALLAVAAGTLGIHAALRSQRRRGRPGLVRDLATALGGALLAVGGLVLLWLQRSGTPAGAGIAQLAAWGACWLALQAPRRLPLALAAGVLLAAVGLLAQLELGLGAPESSWLRHFHKTASLFACAVGAAAMLPALRMLRPARPLRQARAEALLMLLAGVALIALLLQVAFGDETGVFDLQPVEFAKLALAALTAHCLALAAGGQPAPGGMLRRSLRLAAPALLFAVLLGVALVQVDDYSPLILLAVWGGTMALAHALATGQRTASLLLLACAGLVVLGIAGLRGAGPAELAQWNFYADRFMVWLDPGTHPHTGQQVLLGARAILDGGWRGADGSFGLASLGLDAGAALRIPAVQDDFAPAFFLNRHGLAAALALWLLQAAFVAGLLALAVRAWGAQAQARDFRLAWLARLRCFLLCGGAAFVFGHFLLSWGTNLAIFPVMGQPMSFLSAGGSHLLFFICPLLALAAASAQSLEENPSCREPHPASFPASPLPTSSAKS